MSLVIDAAIQHRNQVRSRLVKPPNAVEDKAIDLKRPNPKFVPQEKKIIDDDGTTVTGDIRSIDEKIKWLEEQISFYTQERKRALRHRTLILNAFRPEIHWIKELVCAKFQVSMAELVGETRSRPLVLARHVAIYLCRRLTGKSLPEIGMRFGDRDHTTVLHGINRIEAAIKVDSELRLIVDELAEKISPRSLRPASDQQEATLCPTSTTPSQSLSESSLSRD